MRHFEFKIKTSCFLVAIFLLFLLLLPDSVLATTATGCYTNYCRVNSGEWLIIDVGGTARRVTNKGAGAIDIFVPVAQTAHWDSWLTGDLPGHTVNYTETVCGEGYYFDDSSNELTCKQAPAGSYSEAGSDELKDCPVGYRCPGGTDKQACHSGYWQNETEQASCKPCGGDEWYCPGTTPRTTRESVSSGYYSTGGTSTTRTGQSICETGNYCSSGVKTACVAGYWQDTQGQTSCKECGGNNYYCPGTGNDSRTTVSSGYYSTGGTSTTRTDQDQCPADTYCVGGVKYDCPDGEESPPGSTSELDCVVAEVRVFVSSVAYSANLGGISGARDKCNALAAAAALGGSWEPWLADSTATSAPAYRENFPRLAAPYVRIDGIAIAESWADLTKGSLNAQLNIDQNGLGRNGYPFTNVTTSGTVDNTDILKSCSNWTSNDRYSTERAALGHMWYTDYRWTRFGAQGHCGTTRYLYCFERK